MENQHRVLISYSVILSGLTDNQHAEIAKFSTGEEFSNSQGRRVIHEKHKIFLYKEDFFKFVNALNEAVDHVKNDLMPEFDFEQFENEDSENEMNDELRWE